MPLARADLIEGVSAPGDAIVCTARLVQIGTGFYPNKTSFVSGTYSIVDQSTFPQSTIVPTTALSPIANYLEDYPVDTEAWVQDNTGLNFTLQVSSGVMTSANHAYLIVCVLQQSGGGEVEINFRNITSLSAS